MLEIAYTIIKTRDKVTMEIAEITVAILEHAGKVLDDHTALYVLAYLYYTGEIGVQQSFTRSFPLFKASVEKFPDAHQYLGRMYMLGEGVEENIEKAVKHFFKGAEAGDDKAHMSLGHCYMYGKGVEQSYEKALYHNTQACEIGGSPNAVYNMGLHYFYGYGVERDYKKAVVHYQAASSFSFAPAQARLGSMYYSGLGVTQDKEKAKELCQSAAKAGNKVAKLLLERLEAKTQEEGTVVNQELQSAVKEELRSRGDKRARQLQLLSAIARDISEPNAHLISKLNSEANLSGAEMFNLGTAVLEVRHKVAAPVPKIAAVLYEYAGDQLGDPYAQYAAGRMYYEGVGIEQNFAKAYSLCKACVEQIPEVHNLLGEMYKHGQGVDKNNDEAINHYDKGAAAGDPFAHLSLAHCYTYGKGVEQSYEKAFEHNITAVNITALHIDNIQARELALLNTGDLYCYGYGVELNYKKAVEYYEEAVLNGSPSAQGRLGTMYRYGLGVAQDKAKAKELYSLAVEGGLRRYSNALEELDEQKAEGKEDNRAAHQELESAVKQELNSAGDRRARQLQFLSIIARNDSDPTTQLISELNSETKLSGDEMFELAVAVFNLRNKAFRAAEITAALFEHAGSKLQHDDSLCFFAKMLSEGQGCTMDAMRAVKIFTDLAAKGHLYSHLSLAIHYYYGTGVEQSFSQAFTLLKVCEKNSIKQSHYFLGEMYMQGQGVEENVEEAVKHFKLGADAWDPFAVQSLARCYFHGEGVEQSYEKAFQLSVVASNVGNLSARMEALGKIGYHFYKGLGVELNLKTAAEYFEKSASLGNLVAQTCLAHLYYHDMGDVQKGIELYRLAAEAGERNAKHFLEHLDQEE